MSLIAIPAAIGFILSLVVHVGTFFGHGSMQSAGLLHVLIFPLFIPMVVILNRRGENDLGLLARKLPRWAQILGATTMAYAALNFGLFFLHASEGSPRREGDGSYVLADHGRMVRPITADEFAYHKALEARGFSGHWMVFYLVPALYFGLIYRREQPPTAAVAGAVVARTDSEPPV
jgi:hypothetical protein